jgi:hypothetical protein
LTWNAFRDQHSSTMWPKEPTMARLERQVLEKYDAQLAAGLKRLGFSLPNEDRQ